MSHLISLKTQGTFTNQEVLTKALSTLGFKEIQSNQKKVFLKNYYNRLSDLKAEVVVPRGNVNNLHADLGFAKQENGEFTIIGDSDDQRKLETRLQNLKQVYAEEAVIMTMDQTLATAKQAGRGEPCIERETLADGSTRIRLGWQSEMISANQSLQQY